MRNHPRRTVQFDLMIIAMILWLTNCGVKRKGVKNRNRKRSDFFFLWIFYIMLSIANKIVLLKRDGIVCVRNRRSVSMATGVRPLWVFIHSHNWWLKLITNHEIACDKRAASGFLVCEREAARIESKLWLKKKIIEKLHDQSIEIMYCALLSELSY